MNENSNPEQCYVKFGESDCYKMIDLLKLMSCAQNIVEELTKEKDYPPFAVNAIGFAIALRLAQGKKDDGFSIFSATE